MSRTITVVGDLLLDRDVMGTVDGVCPDAPAPVVDVTTELDRPGGAGLAAVLLAADGHRVTLVAPLAEDRAGARLRELLDEHGVRLVALPSEGTTREKVRVRAGNQSLLRVDLGTACPPSGEPSDEVAAVVTGADAVLVSDYAGGVTSHPGMRTLLERAAASAPVVWDPHARGAEPVAGTTLVTPNGDEAARLSGLAATGIGVLAAARRQANLLVERWNARAVCVTMGSRGALLSYGTDSPLVFPAPTADPSDPCGAGDRFAAAATAGLAEGRLLSESVQDAVQAATDFVAAGGAAGLTARRAGTSGTSQEGRATQDEGLDVVARVRARGGTVVATGGCFDLLHAGHVALLRAARDLGDCLVVCLNSDESVRRIKGADRPLVPQADRARVLEALECVDAVAVFPEDTPEEVLRQIRPDVWAKGGDYALADLPETRVLQEWGGQAVLLPYLGGRSTTGLIDVARNAGAADRTPVKEPS